MRDSADRLIQLREQIAYHNKKYHEEDNPEISDFEYDALYRELEELEDYYSGSGADSEQSPVSLVGGEPSGKFEKTAHSVKMLSLRDVFNIGELNDFIQKTNNILGTEAEYVVEQKIDGLSVCLTYENGKLVRGVTRGNGLIGENITGNIKTIASVPQSIPGNIPLLEIRGEVFMPADSFIRLNEMQEALGQPVFANPRNAAAGSVRQLDPAVTAERMLDVFFFSIQRLEGEKLSSITESLAFLSELGIKTVPGYVLCKTRDDIEKAVMRIGDERGILQYNIDGAVVNVNSLEYGRMLGETSKAPKWAVAYKYPAEQKTTIIKNITVQVGRTGVLTPLAELEPVRIAGSTVGKATLHNADYIKQKDIRIGDTAEIRKAGDIIPEVVEVIAQIRTGKEQEFHMPDKCPVCGAEVIREDGESAYRCSGASCKAQLFRSIVHFVSNHAMNIDGLGPALIERMLEGKLIDGIGDLYRLGEKREQLENMEKLGKRSVDNLLRSIEASKDNSIDRLIFGLGIRHIGERAAKLLAKEFGDVYRLFDVTSEEIEEIGEFGWIMAESVVRFFKQPQTADLIKNLADAGVKMRELKESAILNRSLEGKTFVLTGTLPTLKRNEVSAIIDDHGGKTSSSVSGKTDFVLAGEDAGSKLKKAEILGVKIISEEEFLKMV